MDELKVVYYVFVSMYLCTNVLFQTTRDAGVGGWGQRPGPVLSEDRKHGGNRGESLISCLENHK